MNETEDHLACPACTMNRPLLAFVALLSKAQKA